jgi:RimJ/RimL family protein N-acetyltransferase
MQFVTLTHNDDFGYLSFLLEGLAAFPNCFKLSPDDAAAHAFPSANPEHGFTLGAIEDNRLLGIVTFSALHERRKLAHLGEVSRMLIAADTQGKQIGYAMMGALIAKVRSDFPTIQQLRLNVATHNERAKQLYRKIGFEHFATEKNVIDVDGTLYDDDYMKMFL